MNKTLPTFVTILALGFSCAAGAIERSNSLVVTQNSANGGWTANCTIVAKRIDSRSAYWGDLKIRYDDPDGQITLANVRYSVGPGARVFKERSFGLYSVLVTLAKTSLATTNIVVNIKATRYGPLYGTPFESGTFQCDAGIVEGTGPTGDPGTWNVIDAFNGSEHVGFTQ